MKTLAIDTSGTWGSVALLQGDDVLEERLWRTPPNHSEVLLAQLDELLTAQQTDLKEINLLAVSVGPGSFTGLRIGISAALAIRQVYSIPTVPIATLAALAFSHATAGAALIPMLRAAFDANYGAVYQLQSGAWEEIIAPTLASSKEWIESLQRIPEPRILLAEESLLENRLPWANEFSLVSLSPQKPFVTASAVAKLACFLQQQGKLPQADSLQALYLRPSEAEARLKKS